MAGIAFFDVDGTLIAESTATLYRRFERRTGAARPALARRLTDGALTLYYYALYKANRLDIDPVMTRALAVFAGREASDLRAFCARFVAEEVVRRVGPEARSALAQHRARGDATALLSASIEPVVAAIASALGIDHALATTLTADAGGRLTGDFARPACFGAGKLVYAERLCRERGASLAESSFYTDSMSDLPLLERVGAPRPVNPDWLLRREAVRRGWPVVEWS